MRTVQEIFNAVIDGGQYRLYKEQYMCCALGASCRLGIISPSERDAALYEIRKYLWDELNYTGSVLFVALKRNKLLPRPASAQEWFPVCLAIYRDWANRPHACGTKS